MEIKQGYQVAWKESPEHAKGFKVFLEFYTEKAREEFMAMVKQTGLKFQRMSWASGPKVLAVLTEMEGQYGRNVMEEYGVWELIGAGLFPGLEYRASKASEGYPSMKEFAVAGD